MLTTDGCLSSVAKFSRWLAVTFSRCFTFFLLLKSKADSRRVLMCQHACDRPRILPALLADQLLTHPHTPLAPRRGKKRLNGEDKKEFAQWVGLYWLL